MVRLIVAPDSPNPWTIELKPGINTLGRGPENDFQISDASVSTKHCRLVVEASGVTLQDLGSTNGSFINGARVLEAPLLEGQRLRLGQIDLAVDFGAAKPIPGVPLEELPTATPAAPPRSTGREPSPMLVPGGSTKAAILGTKPCKHHPKSPGRYFCNQCQHYYCEVCVTIRAVAGVAKKLCRHCGVECTTVQTQIQVVEAPGFFARLPGAFLYPLRGSGFLLLLVGTFLMVMLRAGTNLMRWGTLRTLIYSLIIQVVLSGYLYAFMQNVLQTTASEDEEMPQLPGITNFWEDIMIPFFQFLGMTLICFGPALALIVAAAIFKQPAVKIAILPALLLGSVYFPMAFLAVSVLDSVAAANPIFVVPSILRVPREYLVTLLLLVGVILLRMTGDALVQRLFPSGMATTSVPELLLMIVTYCIWTVFGFYLLIVGMRILGLIYVTRKEELGWIKSR